MLTTIRPPARLRSSLANAASVVKEHAPRGVGETIGNAAEVARWPFERAAWAIERGLVWPLQERFGNRELALGTVGAVAVAVGMAGLLWATPGGSGPATQAAAPNGPSIAMKPLSPRTSARHHIHVLHGAAPVLAPPTGGDAAKVASEKTVRAPSPDATGPAKGGVASISSTPAIMGKPAGPAAIAVARRFSDAFVLYETDQGSAQVRSAFASTATPELAHSLLRRPPRQPASFKVPKAKVLNIVAGPSSGGIYTLSVSLLRVGVTSELQIEMEKAKHGKWHVTDVLG
jgi:hypothetical protein